MAYSIEIISHANHSVTKESNAGGGFQYYFSKASVIATNGASSVGGFMQVIPTDNNLHAQTVNFTDLADNLGTTNIVEYVDSLAAEGYFI
jgi:hypothetical protein